MAKWIAQVTVEANHFRLGDGSVMRDSQARKGSDRRRKGCKRAVVEVVEERPSMAERLFKHPRLAALRERVLAKSKG
eukprot:3200938-Karenia_brevis.AAC.1